MDNIIPSDQPSLFEAVTQLRTNDKQRYFAIIRPNNPPPGIAGYLFDIPLEERVSLRSTITDHFIEDNTAIQDQIALPPEEISVRGLVAEIVTASLSRRLHRIIKTIERLRDTPGMEPVLSAQAEERALTQEATKASVVASTENDDSLFATYAAKAGGPPDITKQAKIFGYIYQLWLGRQLFTVETPWGFYTNMAILSADMVQPEDSKNKTEIAITFKKIRIAEDVTVNLGQLAGRAQFQQATVSQNGNAGAATVPPAQKQSILFQMAGPTP